MVEIFSRPLKIVSPVVHFKFLSIFVPQIHTMKTRADIDYFLRKGGTGLMDHKYTDIYDIIIIDGVEHLCIGVGLGDAKDELLFWAESHDGESRKVVGIPISEIRDRIPEFKADDKFVFFLTHPEYGIYHPDVFGIGTGRIDYPTKFNKKFTRKQEKTKK
jgi:hypothetical protein